MASEDDQANQERNSSQGIDSANPDSVREVLDDVEAQIEKVRASVLSLSSERDGLVELLQSINESLQTSSLSDLHKEEVMLEVNRLNARAGDIVIEIKTRRTASQAEAMKGVEAEFSRLVKTVEIDGGQDAETMCKEYIAACGEDVWGQRQSCQKFEQLVLGCALEDQKLVKRRLEELLEQIGEIRKAECDADSVNNIRLDHNVGKGTEDIGSDNKNVKEVSISESLK